MLTPRPQVTIEVQPRARRASPVYLDLLGSGPEKLANFVSELEADPLFSLLEGRGAVRRFSMGETIPRWKRRNREEERAVSLLVTHQLGDIPGWREEFASATGREQWEGLARKYHLRAEEVRIIADYARGEPVGASAQAWADRPLPLDDGKRGPAGRASSAGQERMEKVASFVERYGLSEEQFTGDFLLGEADADSLAQKYGMPAREAKELLELIEEFVTFAGGGDRPGQGPEWAGGLEVVASVREESAGGAPRLVVERFPGWGMYRIDEAMARSVEAEGVSRAHLAGFLAKLKAANEVSNCVARIVSYLFWAQREYFSTLDVLRLRPLSQAEVGRALGIPRSTVCRALKGRGLRTALGVKPLAFFCQKRGEVVRRLAQAHPEMADRELALLLEEEYGRRLGRRSIAHHRRRAKQPGAAHLGAQRSVASEK